MSSVYLHLPPPSEAVAIRSLDAAGHTVWAFSSTDDLLQAARAAPPDLVVVGCRGRDHDVPGALRLDVRTAGIPVVAVGGDCRFPGTVVADAADLGAEVTLRLSPSSADAPPPSRVADITPGADRELALPAGSDLAVTLTVRAVAVAAEAGKELARVLPIDATRSTSSPAATWAS